MFAGLVKNSVVSETVAITARMIDQFAEVSGDFRLIHVDEEYAKSARYGRRIAHDMLSGALISRTLVKHLSEGGIYLGQSLRFLKPIYIGDEVTVELRLNAVRLERGIAVVKTIVKNQSNELCVEGDATIMVEKSAKP